MVLLAAGTWCAVRWKREAGTSTMVVLGTTYLAAFVGSHLLAKPIGAWPAVATVSAVTAGASYLLTGERAGTSVPSRS